MFWAFGCPVDNFRSLVFDSINESKFVQYKPLSQLRERGSWQLAKPGWETTKQQRS